MTRGPTAAALMVLALLVGIALSGCGGGGSVGPSPSPVPARSVTAIRPTKDAKGDFNGLSLRLVEIFVKDSVAPEQRDAMAAEIAAMPEVEVYHFVSKAEALERFRKTFGDKIATSFSGNPLPASFEVVVRTGTDVRAVARRFRNDARVDNTPGTHDGVQYSIQPSG